MVFAEDSSKTARVARVPNLFASQVITSESLITDEREQSLLAGRARFFPELLVILDDCSMLVHNYPPVIQDRMSYLPRSTTT